MKFSLFICISTFFTFIFYRTEQRLQQLQRNLGEAEEDRKGIDGRLASAQTALMLQEETIRRNERERKSMSDKISALERQITTSEADKRQLNVSILEDFIFIYWRLNRSFQMLLYVFEGKTGKAKGKRGSS